MPDQSVLHAAATVRSVLPDSVDVALVLGSGLGALAERVAALRVLQHRDVPGYPEPAAPGHCGRLVFGMWEEKKVLVLQGRAHRYEGYSAHTVSFPIRLAHALGARALVITNSAGGIHQDLAPGALMLIKGHIAPPACHPLRDIAICASSYDAAWTRRVAERARELGFPLCTGVYGWTLGPSYETKAEIRYFARMGADAIGMSTVDEVSQAHALGMRVLGVSMITNKAAGLGPKRIAHDDVLVVGERMQKPMQRLMQVVLRSL